MLQDLRHAARLMLREPGYAAIAVLAIALGIGATTTLFSVTYGVLLKPLPWSEPDRLVRLEERRGGRTGRIPMDDHERHLPCLARVVDCGRDRRMDVPAEHVQRRRRARADPARTPDADRVHGARGARTPGARLRCQGRCYAPGGHGDPLARVLAASLRRGRRCRRPLRSSGLPSLHHRRSHAGGVRLPRSRDAGVDPLTRDAGAQRRRESHLAADLRRHRTDAARCYSGASRC